MRDRSSRLLAATCVAVLLGLAGCGGGDSPTSSINPTGNGPTGGSPPEEIHGIATPSSVAVVTATNAN